MTKRNLNLAELSDDEIANLDPTTMVGSDEASDPANQAEAQPSDTESESLATGDETGGAASAADDEDDEDVGEGTTSEESEEDDGNDEPSTDEPGARATPHQGEDTTLEEAEDESDSTESVGAKAELAALMAPLKAAKRTINVESVEQARQLMQMGVDYSRKMEQMKPYQRFLKTAERNGLLEDGKLNFLIDLANKKPEAIQKLLKDSDIDPMDLDIEDSNSYTPTDHMIGDSELALEEVVEEIKTSPVYEKTVDTVTNWDTASKRILMDNPQVLRFLNGHIEAGIYDMIMDRLESERIFGKHVGLSDLEAYKAVGDAMHAEGAFNAPNPNATSAPGTTNQGQGQDGSHGSSVKDRKRAASPPKGTASARKPKIDFYSLSDEEIEKLDLRAL